MVDRTMREMKTHGDRDFPIATYDWYGPDISGMVLECHWHDEWEFFAIYEGCTVFSVNGEKKLMKENNVIFVPGNSLHTAVPYRDSKCRYRSIVFSMPFLQGLLDDVVQTKYMEPLCANQMGAGIFLPDSPPPGMWQGDRIYPLFQKTYHTLCNPTGPYELLAKSCLYELLAYVVLSTDAIRRPRRGQGAAGAAQSVKKAIIYMNENLSDPITVPQLAAMANMSTGYFGKSFRQMTSYSPIEYLVNLRLSKASCQLLHTDKQILQIALDVGFNNIGYFNRSFRKKYGCPPNRYRKCMGTQNGMHLSGQII